MSIILKMLLYSYLSVSLNFVFSFQRDSWKGSLREEGGIKVISNPKSPIDNKGAISIKEDLVIGDNPQTEDNSFSFLKQIIVDENENIYAADGKESRIKVFGRNGKLIRVIGKKGQGPGELDGIISISFSGRNKELLVQEANRNLEYFSIDGVFRKKATILNETALSVKADHDENVIAFCALLEKTRRYRLIPYQGFVLKKFDKDLKYIGEVASFPAADPNDFDMTRLPVWEIDLSSRIFYGFPDKYEISVYKDGLKKKIRRDWDKVKFSEEELANIKKMLAQAEDIHFADTHGAFSRIFSDDTGKFYVQTWEKDAHNAYLFDIFDEEGRYLAKMALPSGSQVIKNNRLYTIEDNKDGFQVIKRYAIEWK